MYKPNENPIKKAPELRASYSPYINEMAPFYFDLLSTYIDCLSKQSDYTIEDFDVFRKVISLFTIVESAYQYEEEESKEADFLQPKA